MLFKPNPSIDENRKNEIEAIERQYNLLIPGAFKDFYYTHELIADIDPFQFGLIYKSPLLEVHNKREYIELQSFCTPADIRFWINNLLFGEPMFNKEGLQLMNTFGSTFLLLIANSDSEDYGKVIFYDVEEADTEQEVRYKLADSFEEFMSYLTTRII